MALMPRPLAPIAGNMPPTKEWLDYFRQLADSGDMAGVIKAIEKLQQQVDELERVPANEGVVQGIGALRSLGLLSEGLVRLDMVELEDIGGGELMKFSRDQYGRVTGTTNAEAPEDGKQYARQDGGWVETSSAQLMQRITTDGDYRVTSNGDLRVSTWR